MTSRPPPTAGDRPAPTDDDVAWVASHLPEVRRRLAGNEILYWWIAGTLVLGLIANVVGFLWATVASGTIDGLIADLLKSLGVALWTGAVLVLFLQVLPDIQRRASIRALRRYEQEIEARAAREDGPGTPM